MKVIRTVPLTKMSVGVRYICVRGLVCVLVCGVCTCVCVCVVVVFGCVSCVYVYT